VPRDVCPCCYDVEFDERSARAELAEDRRRGPRRATQALASALAGASPAGLTVLDIGAGIGTVHRLLLAAGAASAIDVDASDPYLAAARAEATRLGLADRIQFVHGDFVAVASEVGEADLVALDRVVCCYVDGAALIEAAATRTRQRLGVVLPPDSVPARLAVRAINLWQLVIRSRLRMQAHPHAVVIGAAERAGLSWLGTEAIGVWRLLTFERQVPKITPISSVGSR
jgi:magnesium-protoporphyrin O-methyltransferase